MQTCLNLAIQPQPDDTTCGPTCLHAVYQYHGGAMPLADVLSQVRMLKGGGTLATLLAIHALARGWNAVIYTYNLQVFDPTWFQPGVDIRHKLRRRATGTRNRKMQLAAKAYRKFLKLGGELRFEDLTPALIRKFLTSDRPILTGLSSTYLYRSSRERWEGHTAIDDDIRGNPSGHFVVLCGYDRDTRSVMVADPLKTNPVGQGQQHYSVPVERLIGAVLLSTVTYDANLLIITPPSCPMGDSNGDSGRG